jgi:hypothetical protein
LHIPSEGSVASEPRGMVCVVNLVGGGRLGAPGGAATNTTTVATLGMASVLVVGGVEGARGVTYNANRAGMNVGD